MTSKPDHLERTAAEPRDKSLYTVILQHIEQVNDTTRIFRLGIPRDSPPIRFLPGQWLDVYVPGVEKAGGFTITSTPREARLAHPPAGPEDAGETRRREKLEREREKEKAAQGKEGPYLELAVQKSPDNPPAAWLWQDAGPSPTVVVDDDDGASRSIFSSPIIGSELHVRVGGGFVWPPPGINARALRRVVFVAGGVGVNPLVSMLGFLASSSPPAPTSLTTPQPAAPGGDLEVRFLYSTRDPGAAREGGSGGAEMRRNARGMLFLERIARVFRQGRVKGRLEVFLTGGGGAGTADGEGGEKKKKGEGARTSVDGDGDGDGDNGILVGGGDEGEAEFTIPFHPRRCTVEDDVAAAVGNPRFAVVYVCGVPAMTDEFVAKLTRREDEGGLGMEPYRVLCEKWW
ncbi:hypothetical protein F4824DRAFT_305707 [Ustulina deusta]|nr:hypothetical protein F4824DRAFT_305707 [Ustulina deusta]